MMDLPTMMARMSMDPGWQSGLGTGPQPGYGYQVYPGHPAAQEFAWREVGPAGTMFAAMPMAIGSFVPQPTFSRAFKKWYQDVKNFTGTTEDPYSAGYIMPSGDMLNLRDQTGRWMHHSIVGEFAPKSYSTRVDPTSQFMRAGNAIRMVGNKSNMSSNMARGIPSDTLFLEIKNKPTLSQINKIKEIAPYFDRFYLDSPIRAEARDFNTLRRTIIEAFTKTK